MPRRFIANSQMGVVIDHHPQQWKQLHGLQGADDGALQVGNVDLQAADARGAQVNVPQFGV